MSNGDGASMLFRFAESVVNIAHVPKECLYYPRKQTSVSHATDCDVIVCYGAAKLSDKHLAATVHCVDDEIIGRLKGREQLRLPRRPRLRNEHAIIIEEKCEYSCLNQRHYRFWREAICFHIWQHVLKRRKHNFAPDAPVHIR
jgi:hypothetical protein